MVDPKVSAEFFETIGHIKGRVDAIHDDLHVGDEALIPRVRALEAERNQNTGRKAERGNLGTLIAAIVTSLAAVGTTAYNVFNLFHKH
jgi:hypothetical protein